MKIKRLYINNYKSLVNFELIEPNPFSVFVGPNGAGKSNVFEALEFASYTNFVQADELFGGAKQYFNLSKLKDIGNESNQVSPRLEYLIDGEPFKLDYNISFYKINGTIVAGSKGGAEGMWYKDEPQIYKKVKEEKNLEEKFGEIFSRIFVRMNDLIKIKVSSDKRLSLDAANLENVLHRILQNEAIREELTDWLQLLIPGTEKVEVIKSGISGTYHLRLFEKHLDQPIDKTLISDGTYNILALLTAIYQSDEPQFLCIEEPENGLNPYVISALVEFMRNMCAEKGHYIWLNTHSPALVRELKNEEIILVNKEEGITKAKRVPGDFDIFNLTMDEAWLSNSLGGGLPW